MAKAPAFPGIHSFRLFFFSASHSACARLTGIWVESEKTQSLT